MAMSENNWIGVFSSSPVYIFHLIKISLKDLCFHWLNVGLWKINFKETNETGKI